MFDIKVHLHVSIHPSDPFMVIQKKMCLYKNPHSHLDRSQWKLMNSSALYI